MLIGTKCDLKDATGEIRKGLEDAGMAIGNPVTVAQGNTKETISRNSKENIRCWRFLADSIIREFQQGFTQDLKLSWE